MARTWTNIVPGMDVQAEEVERIGQVKAVGATGVVVRVQRDLYVPFAAIGAVRDAQVVVKASGPLRTTEQVLLDGTREELPLADGYPVADTSIFY